jgi:hypothetical protein
MGLVRVWYGAEGENDQQVMGQWDTHGRSQRDETHARSACHAGVTTT